MKQFKLAALLFVSVALLSSTSFAAVTAPYNWTGVYAGLNAGAVQNTVNITDNQATSFNATLQGVSNPKFTSGFQVGYRRQLDWTKASGVYGLEFSANFSDAKFEKEYGSSFALYDINVKNELKKLFLMQFIGGIAADRTLLFLAAGFSWTDIRGSITNLDSTPFFNSFNINKKSFGTALGGGIEYAFNEKFSARFKVDVVKPTTYTASDDTNDHFQISNSIVQGALGINYKFG